jgi:hypothetical protein
LLIAQSIEGEQENLHLGNQGVVDIEVDAFVIFKINREKTSKNYPK